MNLCNVEHDLSLKALVVGTVKISWTSLTTSDTNSFWDAFNDELIVMASFIPTCFSSTLWVKVFSWVSNLNSYSSLLKNEDICWSSWSKSSSRNAFKSNISSFWRVPTWSFSEIYYEYNGQLFQLLDKKSGGSIPQP